MSRGLLNKYTGHFSIKSSSYPRCSINYLKHNSAILFRLIWLSGECNNQWPMDHQFNLVAGESISEPNHGKFFCVTKYKTAIDTFLPNTF